MAMFFMHKMLCILTVCKIYLLIDCAECSFVGEDVPMDIADPKSKK